MFAEAGNFDIPASWTAGIAWEIVNDFTVMADVKQILYSSVKSISKPMLPNLMIGPLGTHNGAGFGWTDIMVYKVGMTYSGVDSWNLGEVFHLVKIQYQKLK